MFGEMWAEMRAKMGENARKFARISDHFWPNFAKFSHSKLELNFALLSTA